MITYKIVELSIVTDDMIEEAVNTWTRQGWEFDGLHFAMSIGSKRPAMAFIFFTRSLEDTENIEGGREKDV